MILHCEGVSRNRFAVLVAKWSERGNKEDSVENTWTLISVKLWECFDHLLLLCADRKCLEQGRSMAGECVRCVPEKSVRGWVFFCSPCIVLQKSYDSWCTIKDTLNKSSFDVWSIRNIESCMLSSTWRDFATLSLLDPSGLILLWCCAFCGAQQSPAAGSCRHSMFCRSHSGPGLPGFGVRLTESQPYQETTSLYR